MDFRLITVGIAEYAIAATPDILRTILGSCVGVCLYDPEMKIGGMSHVMLPTRRERSSCGKKYADTAIPLMVRELEDRGAVRRRLQAKIVGGARMFTMAENSLMGEIGANNIAKVKEVLSDLGIAVVASDTGGNFGRTVDFYLETGMVKIRSMGREEKVI